MLVAAHISKRHSANVPSRDALKIARAAASIEYRDLVSAGADKMNGSFSHHQAIFINPRSNENLIILFSLSESFTG